MDDVVDFLREQRESPGRRKIYKEQADEHKGAALAADLSRKELALKESIRANRVNWDDVEDVQRRCLSYLGACRDSQSIPTVSGLAALALGVSRQSLNLFMRTHPDAESAQFLQRIKDVFADTLENAALNNYINSIMAIFVMKNDYDRADRVEIQPVAAASPLGDSADAQALMERYGDLPED